jgi:hypothetical protein
LSIQRSSFEGAGHTRGATTRALENPLMAAPESAAVARLQALVDALHGRRKFPAERCAHFARLPKRDLEAAIENTREVHVSLAGKLSRARRYNVRAQLDLALFSCDYAWRQIAQELNRLGAARDALHEVFYPVTVAAYLDYLVSRIRALHELLTRECAFSREIYAPGANLRTEQVTREREARRI